MSCLSTTELINLYGPNWADFVTINKGPFSSPQGCDEECGVCCIPQCDGYCEYCIGYVVKNRSHGTYVITGDVTISYTDPINLCDPWHGGPFIGQSGPPGTDTTSYSHNYTINGTYVFDGFGTWVNTNDPRVSIAGSYDVLELWIDQMGSFNWPITSNIALAGTNSWTGYWGGASWEPSCGSEFDWGDFTPSSPLHGYYTSTIDPETEQCVPDYESLTAWPAGFNVGGTYINIKFIPNNENKSVCEGAGGLFIGLDYFPVTPDQAQDGCMFQSYNSWELHQECDPSDYACRCPEISLDDWIVVGAWYYPIMPGACCEGICSVPYVPDDTLGYCFTSNNCLDFSAVPNTSGCNDTITQSGCLQGGVYSPSGVGIGVWHSGQNCTTFDCNA